MERDDGRDAEPPGVAQQVQNAADAVAFQQPGGKAQAAQSADDRPEFHPQPLFKPPE